jgi:DNA polymerase V
MDRTFMCIDLKSFFASCECIDRGLDPFTTPLVVASTTQGQGALTLAITPCLKKQGIKSRGRLYEIPKDVKYMIVDPRMKLYQEMSAAVISIYLDFIDFTDLHVYSIDECFLDVTSYLKYYGKTDVELAEDILKKIENDTGLTANCGIGPNMLLAKIAMDTEAKKYKNGIAKWTMEDVPKKLWKINPLSDMWGIGPAMEKKLNTLGMYSVGDVANHDKEDLQKRFGIMGVQLWRSCNGLDESVISDLRVPPKEKSFSHSQMLHKDYFKSNIGILVAEMVEVVCTRLRAFNYDCQLVGFGLGYNKYVTGGFYHSIKLEAPTRDPKVILKVCNHMIEEYYDGSAIRKIMISLGKLSQNNSLQLNLFTDFEKQQRDEKLNQSVDKVKLKFGKNSLVKASALLEDSTIMERNEKIGGHHE